MCQNRGLQTQQKRNFLATIATPGRRQPGRSPLELLCRIHGYGIKRGFEQDSDEKAYAAIIAEVCKVED